jgi:hypothetical protein
MPDTSTFLRLVLDRIDLLFSMSASTWSSDVWFVSFFRTNQSLDQQEIVATPGMIF